MKRNTVHDMANQLAQNMSDDQATVKGVFDEFKMQVPRQAKDAAQNFNSEELELLRPDFGSAIDAIKARKR